MKWIVLLVIVAVVIGLMFYAKLKQQDSASDRFPYKKNDALFSPAERSFLGVLQQAIGENYTVFGKVRVADVVSVRSMQNRSAWQRAFNRISGKHFDFILCSKDDLSVVCSIELDDQSHGQRKRQDRDAFLVELCQAVALPLIQVPAQRAYSVSDIRSKVLDRLGQLHQVAVVSSPNESMQTRSQAVDLTPQTKSPHASEADSLYRFHSDAAVKVPACPKCSSPMVYREMKTGSKAGQKFWGCSTFPKCRGVTLSV